MRAFLSRARTALPRWYFTPSPLLLLILLVWPALLVAQADSTAAPPDTHTQFVLGIAGLAAFIAQAVGSAIVNVLNKVGGILEGASAGSKRVLAVALTGALGLAFNAVGALLTHSTSWLLTFGLSIVAGIISTVTTGMAIDTAKAKAGKAIATLKPYQSDIR